MRFAIVIEKGEKCYGAYIPDMPEVFAVGRTKEATLQLIKNSLKEHLKELEEYGVDFPKTRSQSDYIEIDV